MLLDITPLRRHRDFRLLFAGQAISFVGSMITYVAIPYQVFELTRSSSMVGLIGVVELVPLLVAALWGGAYADAMERRRLLVSSELLMACASATLFVNASLPKPSVWLIFAIAAVMSVVNGFHRPTLEAMTQRLVEREELPATAALGSLKYNIGAIGGPALGGLLIAKLGIRTTFAIDVASYVISLLALSMMRPMPAAEGAERPSLRGIVEGLRFAVTRPELLGTYIVDITAMTFAMPVALFPAMSVGFGGAGAVGWLYSAMSAGSLVMTLFSGWTSRVRRHGRAVVLAAAAWGLAIVALSFAPSLPAAVACLMLAGSADMVSGLFRMTIWNTTIPTGMRGRLAGVEMISYMSGPLLGNARAGWVASQSSVPFSILSGGMLCVAGVLLCAIGLPAFWRYDASQVETPTSSPVDA